MKKILLLLSVCVLAFLTSGCGETKEKTEEKDYSNYSFTDVSWTRDALNDIETIIFKSNGRFVYYCSCGNPVNDSDLCETYTYDSETNEITLDCFEETEETVTTVKIVEMSEDVLELDFNGEIRKFETEKQYDLKFN